MPLPQGLLDALESTQQAKDSAEQAAAADTAAQANAQQTAAERSATAATLDQRRGQLDALIDAYFQIGGTPPAGQAEPETPLPATHNRVIAERAESGR